MSYICLSTPREPLADWAKDRMDRLSEAIRIAAGRAGKRLRRTRMTPDLLLVGNSCLLISVVMTFPSGMEAELRLANGREIPIFMLWSRNHPPAPRIIRHLPELVEFKEWSTPEEALAHFQDFLAAAKGEALQAAETRRSVVKVDRGLTSA